MAQAALSGKEVLKQMLQRKQRACPRCGDDLEERSVDGNFAHPECVVRWCETCGWEGEPE